jgi:hypothetical protein
MRFSALSFDFLVKAAGDELDLNLAIICRALEILIAFRFSC